MRYIYTVCDVLGSQILKAIGKSPAIIRVPLTILVLVPIMVLAMIALIRGKGSGDVV